MNSRIFRTGLALVLVSLAAGVSPGHAAVIAWTNTAGGNWSAPANWNPNQVPASTDDVFITNNGTYLVTLDASATINSLTLGGTSGQQRLTNANNSLALAGPSAVNANGVVDFAGSSFSSSGALTVSGIINWQNANWSPAGGVTLTASAVLNIQASLELYGALTNQGTVNWQGGYFRIWNDGSTTTGVVWNQANGLWSIQCDQPMYAANGGEQFHNAGKLRKTGSLGTTVINDYLDNTGTVEAASGTIQLYGNSNLGGGFVADANTVINLYGNYTNGPATSLTGAGYFALTGSATLTLQTNVIANLHLIGGTVFLDSTFQPGGITHLTLEGASLDTTNTLIGDLTMNGGTLSGALTVLSGGVFNMTSATVSCPLIVGGNGVFNFAGGSLDNTNWITVGANGTMNILNAISVSGVITNQGTVNWQSGNIYVYNDGATETGAIWNQVNGIWNISFSGGYSIVAGNGTEQFHNSSLLRQPANAGTSYLQLFLDNSGIVEAQGGTLQLTGGSNLGGTFQAGTNSVIDFGGLNYTNSTALNLTGSGMFQLNSGTLTLLTNPIPNLQLTGGTVLLGPFFQGGTITNLTLNGSTLGGTNIVTGALTLNGGGTTGALTIATNGLLNIVGGTLSIAGLVTNLGAVNWTGGYIYVVNNAGAPDTGEVWNQPGALWNIQCDQTMSTYYGGEQFHNLGELRKTNSYGVSYFYVYLDNSGTVEAQTGTIQLQGGSNLGGNFLADAAATVAFGNVNYSNNIPVHLGGAGALLFNGGSITLFTNPIPNLQMTGGNVLLDASFQGGVITNLTLNGSVLVGTNAVSGHLVLNNSYITGALTVMPGGMLDWGNAVGLAVLTAGSSLAIAPNGVLNITGLVDFQGVATNWGTVNWMAGYIYVVNGNGYLGEIWNQPGAFWNLQCDQSLYNYYGGEQFHNAGVLRKSQSFGASTFFYVYLQNSGTVEAQSGGIQLEGGSDFGGSFIADAGAVIGIGGGGITNSFNPALSFSGAGVFQYNSGTLVLFTNTIPSLQITGGTVLLDASFQGGLITNLSLDGAQLVGTNLVVSGNLALNTGSVTGMVTVLSGATLSATNASLLATTTVNSNGVFNWADGTLGPGNSLTIARGAVLNITGSFLDFQSTVTNDGTVNWESGTVRAYNISGADLSADVWNQAGAVWNALCDASINCGQGTEEFHNAGAFRKNASLGTTYIQLIFDNLGLVDAQSGQIYFNQTAYTLEPGGALNVGINGLLDYGQIYLPGTSPLDGSFGANFNNGYLPEVGDSFTPLTYDAAESGAFTGLNLPRNDSWQTNYSSTAFTLTVLQGLEMMPIPTQFALGSSLFTLTAAVADSEVPPDSLTYSLVSPPGAMTIGASSGVITWTPPNTASTNTIVVNVTDNAVPPLHASASFTLIVVPAHVNVAPVLPNIPANNVNELTLIAITNTAAEADSYATLSYSLLSAPAGAVIDAGGIVTWTPSQAQSHSTNVFTVAVTNTDPYAATTHLGVTGSFTVVVHEVNIAPQLPVILTQRINELSPLTVLNAASEENIHATTLAYGLINPPQGMTINAGGVINWTPGQNQSPSTNLITTVVTNTDAFDTVNPHLTATNTFAVVVTEVNVAPVLPVISAKNVNELALLTVNNAATDSDIHGSLTYGLINPPTNMTISSSGLISWTPSQNQSPGPYKIETIVTNSDPFDYVNPVLTATNFVTVNVIEVNVAPALPVIPSTNINELTPLIINDAATESNIHATITGYGLINPPATASISPAGVFTWTPSQNQSTNTYVITVVATNSDPLDTVHPVLTSTNSFFVHVIEVNVAPVLPVLPNTNINELTQLIVTNTASETDIHATLAYGLLNAPQGMTVNSNGVITWTPSQNQSPGTYVITNVVTNTDLFDLVTPHLYATNSFTVVVKEVNIPPTMPAIFAATNINELTLLTVTNTATELDIHSTLAYALIGPPAGMTIDTNGVITWTPAQTQSPGTYTITTAAISSDPLDSADPEVASINSFIVNVKEVNVAPVLPVIPVQTVNDLALLTVTNTAAESNIHATLTYTLVNNTLGMTISPSGVFSWTPTLAQGHSTNVIMTVVSNTDSFDLINPHYSATNTFQVIVFAPILASIANTNVNPGQTVAFAAAGSDNDPTRTLTYSLTGAPAAASIGASTGNFTWRPGVADANTAPFITVKVSDNSVPQLSATQNFQVTVNALGPVNLLALTHSAAQAQIQVKGPPGPDYILLGSTNLAPGSWTSLLTNTPAASPFVITDTNAGLFPRRFYRIQLGP